MVMAMVSASLMIVSVVVAGPVPGMQKWAGGNATNALRNVGITNAASGAAIMNGWDEDVIVDTAIRENALDLLSLAMGMAPKFSDGNLQKVKAALLAAEKLPANVVAMIKRFPKESDRREFLGRIKTVSTDNSTLLAVKYDVLWDSSFPPVASKVNPVHLTECIGDVVGELVSPARMSLDKATAYKNAIKDLSAVHARLKLAAEGKSFVTRNKVNPIAVAIQPVVDALNAPGCTGLEAALGGLGVTVEAIDRSALKDVATADMAEIRSGMVIGEAASAKLGKICVFLGAAEYNRFVSAYNGETVSK